MSKVASSRWKTQINENSKSKAFVGNLPEVHHNEIPLGIHHDNIP